MAANLEVVLVVDALIGETRPRRVERYLAVAWSSGAIPVVVLTKADLCDDVDAVVQQVREDALGVELLAASSVTGEGLDAVRALLPRGRTGALVGPSGVGKSSLVNALSGEASADTPGMRELSLYDDADGVGTAYADVAVLAADCRFRDRGHRTEPGCAVAAAIDGGRLDPARFVAWRKLQAEAHRALLRVDARARAAEK